MKRHPFASSLLLSGFLPTWPLPTYIRGAVSASTWRREHPQEVIKIFIVAFARKFLDQINIQIYHFISPVFPLAATPASERCQSHSEIMLLVISRLVTCSNEKQQQQQQSPRYFPIITVSRDLLKRKRKKWQSSNNTEIFFQLCFFFFAFTFTFLKSQNPRKIQQFRDYLNTDAHAYSLCLSFFNLLISIFAACSGMPTFLFSSFSLSLSPMRQICMYALVENFAILLRYKTRSRVPLPSYTRLHPFYPSLLILPATSPFSHPNLLLSSPSTDLIPIFYAVSLRIQNSS